MSKEKEADPGRSAPKNSVGNMQLLYGDLRAQLSIALFCYRLARALLGLTAALSSIDALIFTGGIGENNPSIRAQVLTLLAIPHPMIDSKLNEKKMEGRVTDGSAPNQACYAW